MEHPLILQHTLMGQGFIATVMSVDLLPTWVELANTELPTSYKVDGKSIVLLLLGNNMMAQPKHNKFRWRVQ